MLEVAEAIALAFAGSAPGAAAAAPTPTAGAPGAAGAAGRGGLSPEVVVTCCSLLLLLLALWTAHAGLVRSGREVPACRLSLLCLSFALCSWGMNVLNKSLVVALRAPTLVTAAQMLMTVLGSLVLAYGKIKGSWQQVARWSCVPVLFFGMLVSSLFTFEYMSLSLLMVVRNVGPLVTLPIERAVMPPEKQPQVPALAVPALLLLLIGAATYCRAVPGSLSWAGFAFAALNMVLAIADRLAQRRLLTAECSGLSNEACVLLNNLLGLAPTLILACALGEVAKFDAALWFRSGATLLLLLSGVVGSGICYFAVAVQRQISATSFMVLQNAVRVAVVFAGVTLFGDPLGQSTQTIGLILSFGGALLYGKAQADSAEEARAATAVGEKRKLLPK